MTSRKWYWLVPALAVAGIAHLVFEITWLGSDVEAMQRVVMPGSASIELPAGDTTLYFERTSLLSGEVYEVTGSVQVRCRVTGPAGEPVPMVRPTSSVRYQFNRYAGVNMFDLQVDAAGTYLLTCEAPSRFVFAAGRGVGTRIVVAVIGMLVIVGLGVASFFVVRARRRSQRRAAELGRAPIGL